MPSSAVQRWQEWCEAVKRVLDSFPDEANCRKYIPIAKYHSAYGPGMSIKEADKSAGASQSTKNHGFGIQDHGDDPTPR